MRPQEPVGSGDASIIPIEDVAREATFRRLAELVRRADPPPRELMEEVLQIPSGRKPRLLPEGASFPRGSPRSVDDELAVLCYDSDEDEELAVAVRSSKSATRRLTFEGPDQTIEVEVTLSRPRTLFCQLVPAVPARLEIRHGNGTVSGGADAFGSFEAVVPPGPVSFWCCEEEAGSLPMATSWIRI